MSLYRIRRAEISDAEGVSQLFDLYRQFYKRTSDLKGGRSFIDMRLTRQDSVVFVAEAENKDLVAFAQLYFALSSLMMAPTLILNDLYVCEGYRRNKIAAQLIEAVHAYAHTTDAVSIVLETQVENKNAQSLYQKFGYQLENDFVMYALNLKQ